MNINTYELVLDSGTKHGSLRMKESLFYSGESLDAPSEIADMMKKIFHIDEMADEFVYLIAFNGRMKVLGVFEIGHGTGNACLLDARGIFMRAVYVGASYVALVHSHPSGDTTPSRKDREITKKIRDAGELIGIPLMDHIIVGSLGFTSFHKAGLSMQHCQVMSLIFCTKKAGTLSNLCSLSCHFQLYSAIFPYFTVPQQNYKQSVLPVSLPRPLS